MRGPFKKIKKKRCSKCKYIHNVGNIFACEKSGIWLEPVKLICFKHKKEE